jgi:hypothetical protein
VSDSSEVYYKEPGGLRRRRRNGRDDCQRQSSAAMARADRRSRRRAWPKRTLPCSDTWLQHNNCSSQQQQRLETGVTTSSFITYVLLRLTLCRIIVCHHLRRLADESRFNRLSWLELPEHSRSADLPAPAALPLLSWMLFSLSLVETILQPGSRWFIVFISPFAITNCCSWHSLS